jgi:hypothetical protein
MVFTVSLSPASAGTVSVNYATANGTASAGSDYTARVGAITFSAGQTSKTLAVTVRGDATPELNETLFVNISGAVGASIADAQGVGTITNDDGAAVPQAVVWTNAAFVSVSADDLTKTGAAGWNAGAVSTKSLPSGNGAVQFTASETTSRRMFGLNRGSLNQTYTELDFAFSLSTAGRLLIYENRVRRGSLTTYATGDALEIAVEAGVVRYRRNGTLVYTSLVAPSYPLLVDTSLYDPGATLLDARLTGGWQ